MVFFDDRYENIEEAQAHRGGLAVIAVMVEVGISLSSSSKSSAENFPKRILSTYVNCKMWTWSSVEKHYCSLYIHEIERRPPTINARHFSSISPKPFYSVFSGLYNTPFLLIYSPNTINLAC